MEMGGGHTGAEMHLHFSTRLTQGRKNQKRVPTDQPTEGRTEEEPKRVQTDQPTEGRTEQNSQTAGFFSGTEHFN